MCPVPVELPTLSSPCVEGAVVAGAGAALLLSTGWTCCQLLWVTLCPAWSHEWTLCHLPSCLQAEGSRVP